MLHHVEGGCTSGGGANKMPFPNKDRRLESCAVGGWRAQATVFSACTGDLYNVVGKA